MSVTTTETVFALRAPGSGWLATLICALDEASRDPDFDEYHRRLLVQLLREGAPGAAVVAAAHRRMAEFESVLADGRDALPASPALPSASAPPPARQRPSLSLVGGSL
ncbi:MAG: hypothetical protein ABFC67_05505 [Mizugakiibacter sp.]|uniref:hypothetical protein n=1 Tax=Mizugakiibacter sp. TaxID=1972610 RepID=UPI0031C85999|nr:hypothetical protein [Xanthomonadaceae bacterium]